MKRKFVHLSTLILVTGCASAQGLYNVGSEAQKSTPLKWSVGVNLIYDDNISPGNLKTDGATSANPFVTLSFVNITPQTTWDVYTNLGAVCYFDKPSDAGVNDVNSQSSAGVNLTHRFDERLRFSSRNSMSYQLEPDYSLGLATSRQAGAYFNWQTDNSLGYRWSERVGTYTGVTLSGLSYQDVQNQDRNSWMLYNQFRYQLNPQQTVLTLEYRYTETTGDNYASDSTDHHILAGIEHRFSPSTILITRAGVQLHDVVGGANTSNPYLEMALNTQVNEEFSLKGFVRYSVEAYDTVQFIGTDYYDFDQRKTLRLGISSQYAISPMFSIIGGVDYIPSVYDNGRRVSHGPGPDTAGGLQDDLINLTLGLQVKFNTNFYGTLSYNYTDSVSDIFYHDYQRNRVSIGVRYEF